VKINALYRSTSARLSLAFGVILILALTIGGSLITASVRQTTESELQQNLELEINAIETELQQEGLEAMISAIQARSERPGALMYWLTDQGGKRLIGDSTVRVSANNFARIQLPSFTPPDQGPRDILALGRPLSNGMFLVVGEDMRSVFQVQDAIFNNLILVGLFTVALGIFASIWVSRRFLTQMKSLNSVMRQVAEGDISVRVPVSASSATDIDEICQLTNQMLSRIEELVNGFRRVSRDVAHDLRTPLSHLLQRLEKVSAHLQEQHQDLYLIEDAQEKTIEIIRNFDAILRLSEIESQTPQHRFESFDLGQIVLNVIEAYKPELESSGYSLVMETSGHSRIYGDPSLITQALANLIENCFRHTSSGTLIKISLHQHSETVQLAVEDNGSGIPLDKHDWVVQPFARLDEARTTPGSGLGLSLVAAIAKAHSARLNIENLDPGLRVSLVFKPRANPS